MGRPKASNGKAALDAGVNEKAPGYAPSGESEHSRRAAHSRQRSLPSATPARLGKGRELTLPELIVETQGRLRWIAAELQTEPNKARRDKLLKSQQIKSNYLADLQRGVQ